RRAADHVAAPAVDRRADLAGDARLVPDLFDAARPERPGIHTDRLGAGVELFEHPRHDRPRRFGVAIAEGELLVHRAARRDLPGGGVAFALDRGGACVAD